MTRGFSVDGVLGALAAQPAKAPGGGRAIMLIAARANEGVTRLACAVAQATGAGSVYAIDLDLKRNALARALAESAPLGPSIDGDLNGVRFYEARNGGGAPLVAPAFGYRRVGRSRVYAGVFDARALPTGARVALLANADYWNAARTGGACAVVAAPALEQNKAALRVARHMDGIVLIVDGERGSAPAAMAAKAALAGAGGNLIGLVYAGASEQTLMIDRLLRQAG